MIDQGDRSKDEAATLLRETDEDGRSVMANGLAEEDEATATAAAEIAPESLLNLPIFWENYAVRVPPFHRDWTWISLYSRSNRIQIDSLQNQCRRKPP